MSADQIELLLLLAAILVLFALDRFRTEVVALSGLALGAALGLVPAAAIFSGFANPAVITVLEVLLIVQVLARSHLLDRIALAIGARRPRPRLILGVLCLLAAASSVFMNNVGAFVLILPIALGVARRAGLHAGAVVMPVSFATLLGGLCSAIGTPANLIVSNALAGAGGTPFQFFDFAPVGLAAAAAGLGAIVLWAPVALGRESVLEGDPAPAQERPVVTELRIRKGGRGDGAEVTQLGALLAGRVISVFREGRHLFPPSRTRALAAGDVVVVEAPLPRLDALRAEGAVLLPDDPAPAGARIEAVVMPQSTLVGSRVATIQWMREKGVRVLAVARTSPRIEGRFDDVALGIGDILVLEGPRAAILEALEQCDAIPVAPAGRPLPEDPRLLPLLLFGFGILAAGFEFMPPQIALGLVVLGLVLTGRLSLREALADINWPIVLMLAAMIPLGEALATTGTAELLARAVTGALPEHSSLTLAAAMLFLALAVTPFVNNATTAIVLSPVAVELAHADHIAPEPLLIAVAIGVSLDFLTPFGHHNNTLALGIGGYRFGDFARLGGVVTLAALAAAIPMIWLIWT
ncbi:MAG TPA: SLC13 family permease [Paracoccaceae bacterium]|nr:SLC13 family permease [Paracoccaceae bacterium]